MVAFAGLAALLLTGCAAEAEAPATAQAAPPALELSGRVVDAAKITDPKEADLTRTLETLEKDTGVQMVVATTPSLNGRTITDYSLDLANSWGLGNAERDDGLLLLVAPTERHVRIEVGYGLEASVRDEEASFIIRNEILPHFRSGEYETGITAAVDALIREVTPYELKEAA
ncbi:MAG: TPM domain-containing protein [Pseudomonadota bacterium]